MFVFLHGLKSVYVTVAVFVYMYVCISAWAKSVFVTVAVFVYMYVSMSAWVKSVYVAVAVFVYMHACSLCLHGLSLSM